MRLPCSLIPRRAPTPSFRVSSRALSLATARERGAPIDIHPEVQDALEAGRPVVALETAVITHGFPAPRCLDLGRELEGLVREGGAVPATIGFVGGRVKVGLNPGQLERLAYRAENPVKVSRRDVAAAITAGADGGTTCSTTLIFAALAGIKVFSTGGLGGVHRGAESTMDVSADLHELTRCPVGLVSAGVKSILDIGRTLEYLETLGVPVISYAKTRDFPAFFTPRSGYEVPWNVNDPASAAKILHTHWQLGMENGALFAAPIPEEYEAAGLKIQEAVDQAVAESEANGISKRGKEATPWLLKRVSELTGGTSEASNVALLKNTALIGGQIATEYAKLTNANKGVSTFTPPASFAPRRDASPLSGTGQLLTPQPTPPLPAKLLVIGSAAVDLTSQAAPSSDTQLAAHSTVPGTVVSSLGGVARNIAEAAHRCSADEQATLLIAPHGADAFGSLLKDGTRSIGMRVDGLVSSPGATAVCSLMLDGTGNLVSGVAAMDITRDFKADTIIEHIQKHNPQVVALDGNLSPEALTAVVKHCYKNGVRSTEPTSLTKSISILPAAFDCLPPTGGRAPVTFATPNLIELEHMYRTAVLGDPFDAMSHRGWWSTLDTLALGDAFRMDIEQLSRQPASPDGDASLGTLAFLRERGIAQMAVNLLPFFEHLVVKCGPLGALVAMRLHDPADATGWAAERSNPRQRYIVAHGRDGAKVILRHFPAFPVSEIVNTTGAGDTFVGSFLSGIVAKPDAMHSLDTMKALVDASQKAAITTMQSHAAVSPLLKPVVL
ncbi:Indigoidine synthase A like protein-domain-containing protein [Schizophyllum amplum]|uniref:Indigoidine synthase A like protein-domain-containing protein n=1 Tax=Schizophyllum amplum TaxID=97359 RepID=A0A550C5Z6_9AGAR|nr:Indigoidine synthase A like protein-domain-containing protein [Auriculariopsis ampla]